MTACLLAVLDTAELGESRRTGDMVTTASLESSNSGRHRQSAIGGCSDQPLQRSRKQDEGAEVVAFQSRHGSSRLTV